MTAQYNSILCLSVCTCVDVEPLAGVIALGYHDLRDPQTLERIKQLLKGNKLDVVMRYSELACAQVEMYKGVPVYIL